MTIRHVDWHNIPDEPERLAWVAWFERYGIDPRDVAVTPGWVEADDTGRTIAFTKIIRDADGHAMPDPANPDRVWSGAYVVQLEAPALPFPEA